MTDRAPTIATLNDQFRTTFEGGNVFVTIGVQALGHNAVATILDRVRLFARFDEANDPHGEHDFGVIDGDGPKIFWKIDYYDCALTHHSPDVANPAVTARVLTIMLAEEY